MNGILPLYKPPGCTSHDMVVWARRTLGEKKIGHAGTLDPGVSGVLPLCIGKATRLTEYLHQWPKEYDGEMVLGMTTDTLDGDGRITAEVPVQALDESQVAAVFQAFTGEIEQEPPLYSAVKVRGKKLYQYARENVAVSVPKRRVTIHALRLLGMERRGKTVAIQFNVVCSTGTYIRSLCRDIGRELGYPAYMSQLERIRSGPFTLRDCWRQDQVEEAVAAGEVHRLLHPLDAALVHLPVLTLEPAVAQRLSHGQTLRLDPAGFPPGQYPDGTYRVYRANNGEKQLIATAVLRREASFLTVKPEKVLQAG